MSKLINLFFDSDKLEGTKSYKTWHLLIESTLIYNELWQGICDGDVKPNNPTNADALAKWEIKNAKALALIKSSVNDEMYVHIENATDAWTALKTFKDLFDAHPESNKVDLQLKLLQQKLTEGGDVLEYLSRLKNIKQEIINVAFPTIDDSFMVTIIVLEEEAEGIKIKQHIIEVEAKSRGNNFNRGGRNNFQGRGNNQGRGNFQEQGYNNQGRGRSQNRSQSRGRGQSSGRGRDLSQIVCRRCNKVGHYAEDCHTSLNKIPKFQQPLAQFANDQDEDSSEYVFTSSPESQISSHIRSDYEDAWILDSGATQHMTCRRDFFWNFQECQLDSIFLADDTKHTPNGKGVVKVFLPDIGEKMISNVWYVPSFKKNLLCLVTIRQAGH
eukprot:PITA_22127